MAKFTNERKLTGERWEGLQEREGEMIAVDS